MMSTGTCSNDTFDSDAFLQTVSHSAGVYRMMGREEEVLYVGKAKNLQQRLSSYFKATVTNSRIWSMLKQVVAIKITLTETETEALLLESNFIKKYKTRYNVLLRDDKSYPSIYLSSHKRYPQLRFHRGKQAKQGQYFGPYTSANAVRDSLKLLQKLFQVRQCEDSVFANRSRPCLQYQIKRCSAPCTQLISPQDYQRSVQHSCAFLEGKSQPIIDDLVHAMQQAAAQQQFEQAALYRDRIETLRQISQQQYIQSTHKNVDVIALHYQANVAAVHVLSVRQGKTIANKDFLPQLPQLDIEAIDILTAFIAQYYLNHRVPKEIITNMPVRNKVLLSASLAENVSYKVCLKQQVRGTRAKWLAMANHNAQYALTTQLNSKANSQARFIALQEVLALKALPQRMECFDISHTMGEATVASCVVFTLAGAAKREYRRFNIHNITAGDDYAAMYQVLKRRFKGIATQNTAALQKKPDIIFIDGGKGQVQQAIKVLTELKIEGIEIIGIAKGEGRKAGLETLITHQGTQRLQLDAHAIALHLIQSIRDESHRFAITAHRKQRHKTRLHSPLEGIAGLGAKRRQLLLAQFGGMQALSRASVEELMKIKGIGRTLAQCVYQALH